MRLLNLSKIAGSGFTLIAVEADPLKSKLTQERLDSMCDDLTKIMVKYGFDISLICENEEAARVQAKVMLDRYWRHIDAGYVAVEGT